MTRDSSEKWRDKLRPIFFAAATAICEYERDLREIERRYRGELKSQSDVPPEAREAALSHFMSQIDQRGAQLERELDEISQRFGDVPYNRLPFGYLYTPTGARDDESNAFVRVLHWARHQESVDATIARDQMGDSKAWDDWHRTGADIRKLAHRKGPIKPFKVDLAHRDLVQLVMAYEVEPLTADERAECFDAYCVCGKSHDADALKRLHKRLKQDLIRSQKLSAASVRPPEG